MKIHGDCPNCKEKVTIDIDKLEIKSPKNLENASAETQQVLLEKPVEKPKEPELKIETKTVIEDFKPNYECPDGNCDMGGMHKNKNYRTKPKGKCTNCGQFTRHDKGTCPWCKKEEIEELEPEELEDLGITEPEIIEHEGHSHE